MIEYDKLTRIRKELFYDSEEYTKNQPDFYLGHKQQLIPPSEAKQFMSRVKASVTEKDIMLYLHFPFCADECSFCNTFPHKVNRQQQDLYINNIIREIEMFAEYDILNDKNVKCIYFGGGTPTAFSNKQLTRVIDTIKSLVSLDPNCSFTTEAHPATLKSCSRVKELCSMGINRISIGCQSFDPKVQQLCNRINGEELIAEVIQIAHENNIKINIDMMSGLPGQTVESVCNDLLILKRLQPDAVEYMRHEIVNPLAVDLLKKNPDLIVDGDSLFEMVHITQQWMAENGYEQNGTFDSTDQWEYRYHWIDEMPIISFGARARSYTKDFCFDKHEELKTYDLMLKRGLPPVGRFISLSKREKMFRTIFLSIQRKQGINIGKFCDEYDQNPYETFKKLFDRLVEFECITITEDTIKLTAEGAYFIEDICDRIIDYALKEESSDLVRLANSEGSKSASLK